MESTHTAHPYRTNINIGLISTDHYCRTSSLLPKDSWRKWTQDWAARLHIHLLLCHPSNCKLKCDLRWERHNNWHAQGTDI